MTDFTVSLSGNDDTETIPNSASGIDTCLECGLQLFYSGRGRHPKYCEEHKPNRNPNTTSSPRTSKDLASVQATLQDFYMTLGGAVMIIDDFDGMVIVERAPKLAESWIKLANSNPNVKKFLIKATSGGGFAAVIMAHASLALPILKHHDMLPTVFGSRQQ